MKNHLLQFRTLSVLAAALLTAQLALADSELWIGNPGVTTTTNWSDSANWSGTTKGPGGNTVFFGNTYAVAPGLINNVVDISTNCYALCYTNSVGANTTLIQPGVTLTNIGNNGGPALLFTPNAQTSNTNAITGATGTLLITGGSAGGITVTVTNSGGTGLQPLLDLSGLGTLTINNADSTAAINIANSASRPGGKLYLAMTNFINLPATGTGGSAAIVIGSATSNNGSSPGGVVYLGITNTIFAGNIGVGLSKQSAATLAFNPAFLANNPAAYIRGPGGSAVTNWAIGDGINTSGTSTGPGGTVNFNGGTVNAVVSAMWLGKPSQTSATAPTATGTLSFSAGTLSVANLTNGCGVAPTTGGPGKATGTINVSGTGLLTVSNLVLAFFGTGSTSSTGTLNITNGAVQANTIIATIGGNGSINMVGGTLIVTNTIAQPLGTLSVSNSTLTLPVVSTSPSITVTNLNILTVGANDTLNLSAVPPTAPPAQYPVISYTALGYSLPDFTLGTLPAPYQGFISNNTTASSVDLVITNSSAKNDTWNGNHNGNWDTTTLNWLYLRSPVYYGQGDPVTFDDTLTGTSHVILATNVTPSAIGFNNQYTNYVLSGTNSITGGTGLTLGNNSGSVTLTESGGDNFSGGITVNSGTLILDNPNSAILGGLLINGGTVQIGNNDGNGALPGGAVTDDGALVFDLTNNVTVATAIAGSGALTQSGSGTLTLSGANAYTGNTTVGNGTLALSGSGTISNSASVSVNSATFDVSALSQPATVYTLTLNNANINVAPNASLSPAIIAEYGLTFAGATNRINVASFPTIARYPVTFTNIQSLYYAASGPFNVGVGSLPTATPPYGATVTLSGNGMEVLLTVTNGPVGLRPSVLWTGADAPTTINWSDALNWQLPGAPVPGDNVIFNPTDAQTSPAVSPPGGGASALQSYYVNNIVDTNFTIASLTFTNVNGTYHNTLISNGLTLTITNSLTVGSGSTSGDFGSGATEFVTIVGTNGTLSVNNTTTNGTIYVGLGSSTAGAHQATLDLSALGTFNANISRLLLGAGSSSVGFGLGRESAVVYLAQTNTITASLAVSGTETSDTSAAAVALDIGDNDGNPGNTCYLYLGQTNAIFAGAICTARQKQSAQMLFNPALTLPAAWFRAADGVSAVGTWSLGDGVENAGSEGSTGVNDFTGGTVNALVNNMYVGRAAYTATGSGTSTGTLTFDDGVFNVSTLYIGYQPTNSAKAGQGTLNVNSNATAGAGATLVVTGDLNLGLSMGGTGAASTSGTLNLTNGTVLANAIVPGVNSTINVAGGWLVVTNPVDPLDTLTLASLGTADNSATLLSLPVRTNSPGITVVTLNLDGLGNTTNIINVESVGPVGPAPVELALIKYTTLNPGGGIFNVGLGKLPSGYAGHLANDTDNSEIALILTTALHPNPAITAFSVQAATNLVFSGANGFANVPYAVLASTNVAAPLTNWTSIANGIFGSDGSFNFTVPVNAATPQRFFVLQVQ